MCLRVMATFELQEYGWIVAKRPYGLQTWKYLLSVPSQKTFVSAIVFGPFELLLLLHNKYSSADFIIQNKNHNEYNLPTHMLKKYNIML